MALLLPQRPLAVVAHLASTVSLLALYVLLLFTHATAAVIFVSAMPFAVAGVAVSQYYQVRRSERAAATYALDLSGAAAACVAGVVLLVGVGVDGALLFLAALSGVEDPEIKRKRIGNKFIAVFEEEASKLGEIEYLAQGTLYPDVIESVSVLGPSATIKSHHNVGGLPPHMKFKLIEPLRELFKDEVRILGKELGLPNEMIQRQPFPGPGLAIRVLGEVTEDRLKVLRDADVIVLDEVKAAGLYEKIWQSFAVLLPIKTVGVVGDERSYENVIALRVVDSLDGMTADWVALPFDLLGKISNRILNEVRGVNRVVYDISSKPPATIEWE